MNLFNKSRVALAFSAFFITILTAGLATQASASSHCKAFPKVAAWGDYDHARVNEIIATRLDGDWDKYVDYLEKRLKLIKDVLAQGRSLVLTQGAKRYKYEGVELGIYVGAAEERLRVVRCMARESSLTKLNSFTTAAGPSDSPIEQMSASIDGSPQVAELKESGFDLSIETSCVNGLAMFKITNRGETWPMRGTIGIYRLGNGDPLQVHARSMRFSGDQTMTFRVPPKKNPTGKLGMFVNPSWVKRPFTIDTSLNCV